MMMVLDKIQRANANESREKWNSLLFLFIVGIDRLKRNRFESFENEIMNQNGCRSDNRSIEKIFPFFFFFFCDVLVW